LVAEEILETADTIEGNSVLKANYVTEKYGYNCFADDTGRSRSPKRRSWVFSAGYAGEQRSAENNMDKLLRVLSNQSNRNAQFKTVVTLNNGIPTGTQQRRDYLIQSRKRRFRLRSIA
jgi:XTP/dITP diphosphohydrolase